MRRARILLGMELHSTRPLAAKQPGIAASNANVSKRTNARTYLFIAQGFDGIEFSGARSRIEAGGKTDKHGKSEGGEHQPHGHGRKLNGIEILAVEIKIGSKSECAAKQPAEEHAENSAEETHHAGFHEEKLLNVGISCA